MEITHISPENTLQECAWLASIRDAWFRYGKNAVPWWTIVTTWGQDMLHCEEVMN